MTGQGNRIAARRSRAASKACVLVLVATSAIAACSSPIATSPPSRVASLIAVPTQPPEPSSGSPAPCPAALLRGLLIRDATVGLAVYEETAFTWKVVWPHGYAADEAAGRRVLLDEKGRQIAFEGDLVGVPGAGDYPGGWTACGTTRVIRSAAGTTVPAFVAVLTHAPRPAGAPATCAAGAITGILIRAAAPYGLAVAATNTGTWMVAWPYGYAARDVGATRVLVDVEGTTVATEGDRVTVGGAGSAQQVWAECGGVQALPPIVPAHSEAPSSS